MNDLDDRRNGRLEIRCTFQVPVEEQSPAAILHLLQGWLRELDLELNGEAITFELTYVPRMEPLEVRRTEPPTELRSFIDTARDLSRRSVTLLRAAGLAQNTPLVQAWEDLCDRDIAELLPETVTKWLELVDALEEHLDNIVTDAEAQATEAQTRLRDLRAVLAKRKSF